MNIDGKSAIVTGAGSGLGAATARHLARLGAKVAVLDLNIDAAREVADEIGGVAIACDVTSSAAAEEALRIARELHGSVRIMINCAGIGGGQRIVGKNGPQALDAFNRIVHVNLGGTFNMLRLAAAEMIGAPPLDDGERGVIICTSSVAAYEGQIGQAAYAAAKGGIVSLTLPAAREFAQFGVRVMTIAPGLFHTPLMNTLPENVRTELSKSVPYPARLGKPSEFAELTAAIINNRFLNGEVIRLDGALRLPPR